MNRLLISSVVMALMIATANAHDLFLKLDTYLLKPNSRATVRFMNGTFASSDGQIAADRIRDISLIMPGDEVTHPDTTTLRNEAKTTLLDISTEEPGTYLLSVSTKPRGIDLKALEFNEYLEHDGVPDILEARKKTGDWRKSARELYSKHVKAIFQVGETLTENYKTQLGYPAEIVPLQNPYSLRVGETLEVLCLREGKPIPNQFVGAGTETRGRLGRQTNARTDSNGVARFVLKAAGKWYIRMIYMEPIKDPNFDYESNWATLTFEVM